MLFTTAADHTPGYPHPTGSPLPIEALPAILATVAQEKKQHHDRGRTKSPMPRTAAHFQRGECLGRKLHPGDASHRFLADKHLINPTFNAP
ncbi:hypothetical protein M8494_20715 [Serratia ureilytica]